MVRFSHVDPLELSLGRKVLSCLPTQGAIEIQHDSPDKMHNWHQHTTDETLIIVSGSLTFKWEGNERLCHPGDMVHLPKNIKHTSSAGSDGAVYLIAFQVLDNI